MVTALQQHIEQEQNGETSLTLLSLRYVGDRSSMAAGNALNSQGYWPGTNVFNQGVAYFALVPDEGLGYLENRDDFEVLYSPEEIAEAMLEQDNLPSNVFGRGADQKLQDRVHEHLGIESPMEAGPVDEQLKNIAGVDEDEETAADEDGGRVARYVDTYTRDQLGDAVKALREDTDEFSLRGAGKTERAEFVAEFDEDEAAAALPDTDAEGDE